jgi:hypothetical protein
MSAAISEPEKASKSYFHISSYQYVQVAYRPDKITDKQQAMP